MARTACLLAAALLLVCTAPAFSQTYQGRELVDARLIADTTAIVPGKPFTVGLLLRMAPGWHTYWKFPGDAGIPTEIKWNLPSGWKTGDIQWPLPLKLVEPGDIQIYGYDTEVLLLQEITPPPTIGSSTVTLAAEASWLVCERICIPGGAKLQLPLPIAASSTPAHHELFARYRSLVPQSWPANVATQTWSREGENVVLTVKSPALANYAALDFFPLPRGNVVIGHPKTERNGDAISFRIPIESQDKSIAKLDGLVVFGQQENGAGRNAWSVAADAITAAAPASGSLAKFLLFGLIGGFILNLMPCVLPVISLKIFGFVKQAGQSRRRIFSNGVAFVAGIFAWFVGLALLLIVLKSAGREITWAFQFTTPAFVLVMSVIVLVFALNLFGVFEITLAQGASRRVIDFTEREGYLGSFFQGVFATILATPCTAPFLGTALGFAFTQSGIVILAMFIAIAAGMGLPYLLLSAEPGWLRMLPKPGKWMVHMKQGMGFLLLATLVFLLSVLGAQRGVEAVIWSVCFLLAISVACWLRGAFMTPVSSFGTRAVALVIGVVILVSSGIYFIGIKFSQTRLPAAASELADGWQRFTPERLAAEQARGNAVFVDFTAAWCLSCKFNEATVLENSAVRAAFDRFRVVRLKADWTNADPVITRILKQFGRPGVPLYVLYPPGREPLVFPELLTKNMVLEKLESLGKNVATE